ncbi:MAG: DUF5060 domain-containing protein [Ginsengibacter sp.]
MKRRELLKYGSVAALAGVIPRASALASERNFSNGTTVKQYDIFELTLKGPSNGNPFLEISISAIFTLGHRNVEVEGFYDGNGKYKIRFMPDTIGSWAYQTKSDSKLLNGKKGNFTCIKASGNNHGPVSVARTWHFSYADGTPFFPFGTTCYGWIHQSDAMVEQTLETLKANAFNKVRMCVFPKWYEYNRDEPKFYPFPRTDDKSQPNDFSHFNPDFFENLDYCVGKLRELGIEADIILFHPYDHWGYADMPVEVQERYVRYLIARLSAYRNVWWSLANEYDFMKNMSAQDFRHLLYLVQQYDPYQHLRSMHYSRKIPDYADPVYTHASLQTANFSKGIKWRNDWKKPVVYDEVQYEGNIPSRWGNITGEELTRRFWLGIMVGCYVSHGETILKPGDETNKQQDLWWSKGGVLRGESPKRIAFIKKIVEESTVTGFTPSENSKVATETSNPANPKLKILIFYFDCHQPLLWEYHLDDNQYKAELIDTWNMEIRQLPGTYTKKAELKLIGKPRQLIRFTQI